MLKYPTVNQNPGAPGTVKNLGPLDIAKIGKTPLKKGSSGKEVKHVQQMLFELGYDITSSTPGSAVKFLDAVDGGFGGGTEAGVKLFQQDRAGGSADKADWDGNALKVNGIVDAKTADALNRAMVGIWYQTYFSKDEKGDAVPKPPKKPLVTHDPDNTLTIVAGLFTVVVHGVPDPPAGAAAAAGPPKRPDRSANYVPNDPNAAGSAMREVHLITLHASTPTYPTFSFDSGAASFTAQPAAYPGHDTQTAFHANRPFNFHTAEVHIAVARTVRVWRALGARISQWNGGANLRIMVRQAGTPPPNTNNAFYSPPGFPNAPRLDFFQVNDRGTAPPTAKAPKFVFFCNSPDIVCHETGHGILDAIRPDLLAGVIFEVRAFHEAFGDISSILTALTDHDVRETLLNNAGANLRTTSNLVSKLAEEIGQMDFNIDTATDHPIPTGFPTGIYGPGKSNSSFMRDAVNNFTWIDPFIFQGAPVNNWVPNPALPPVFPSAPKPPTPDNQMASEFHYFARIFTGAWYETLARIFDRQKATVTPNDDALRQAASIAGRLLITALTPAAHSPIPPSGDQAPPAGAPAGTPNNPNIRFFRVVALAMARADKALFSRRFHDDLKNAFGSAGKQIVTDKEIDAIK